MIRRLDDALAGRHYFEASWYAYALLEDRLISLLKSARSTQSVHMMGPKIGALNRLAQSDAVLAANYERTRLSAWKDDRNNLMHAMAEGSMSIEDIDAKAAALAAEGRELVRLYSAAARRTKKRV
jgi:hypothetical protein